MNLKKLIQVGLKTVYHKKNNNCLKICLGILFFGSVVALALAYLSQYAFHLEPCVLCFYQRKPFFFIAILAFFSLVFVKKESQQKLLIFVCLALLAANSAIAFYHSGVEKKIFVGPASCTSNKLNEISDINELIKTIESTPAIRCDEPQFFFLGLTMAQWNFFYCLGLIVLIANLLGEAKRQAKKKKGKKKKD